VLNNGNTMANHCLFTLHLEHLASTPQPPWSSGFTTVGAADMSCTTVRSSTGINQTFSRQAAIAGTTAASNILDLAPLDTISCDSQADTWLGYAPFLAPGNLTLSVDGSFNGLGSVQGSAMWVIIPKSPQLVLHINILKCQLIMQGGEGEGEAELCVWER
jgi:hypothetical protein